MAPSSEFSMEPRVAPVTGDILFSSTILPPLIVMDARAYALCTARPQACKARQMGMKAIKP